MSQPYDRSARIPQPGKLDKSLGEWWEENPWEISVKHNLSCFERNRVFWNVASNGARDFLEFSYLSGADSEGDGRAVVAADLRNSGQLDLVVRQVGGGALLVFENRFPKGNYLEISLRGHPQQGTVPTSNRQGIGARILAQVKGQTLVREMYPTNSYVSAAPNIVHLGLADADRVDRLVIRWPSGKEQVFHDVRGNRHIVVDERQEGEAALETVVPGKTIRP